MAMTAPLWKWEALVAASGGVADGAPSVAISGFSLDSRAMAAGEVFVALKDQRDGHEFVTAAFKSGAAAALVSTAYARQPGDGALLRVDDPLRGLERIGAAARARLAPDSRVIAVTGSAGKTGTKEMLRACLSGLGATHAPEKSFNNHWGVPLTLARMPAGTKFGVFEIGMNHAGEITPLTKLVRPHVAIITNVLPVHLGHFASEEAIADAKAEIFAGLEPNGTAVLNRDNRHFGQLADRLAERWTTASPVKMLSFGLHAQADLQPSQWEIGADGSRVRVAIAGRDVSYALAAAGEHIAMNSLAVAAALSAAGAEVARGLAALAAFGAPAGRGAREELNGPGGKILLVDEAYNANPASMRAAFATLALVPRSSYGRRIAVLGDMLELGERSIELHAGLKESIDAHGIDLVFACGEHMRALYDRLEAGQQGGWAATSDSLKAALMGAVRGGDAVVVKGSNGSRMGPLVQALRAGWSSTGG